MEKIENLQNHNNNDIYDKAMKILEGKPTTLKLQPGRLNLKSQTINIKP